MSEAVAEKPKAVRRSGRIEKIKGAGGRVVWRVTYFDVDGRRRRESTDATTKQVARRIPAERQNSVEQAKLQKLGSVRELLAPAPSMTLRAFADEYIKHIRAHRTRESARRNESHLRVYILPRLGSLALSEITPGHVQRYADERLSGPGRQRGGKRAEVSYRPRPATVRHELMTLLGLFREARKSGLVKENPVALVKKPKMENEIVRYLDADEEARLLAFAPEPLRSAILVSIHSGLREGELAALTWSDVRFNERSIVVRHSKNGSFRVVPMSDTLYRTLDAIPRHVASPYVITNTDTGKAYGRFNNTVWRATLKRAGISSFRWHDLRHTFGSRLAQAGEPLLAIRDLMGHKQIQVTMRYAYLAPSNLRTAVLALDRMGAEGVRMAESAPRSAPRPSEPRPAVM